MSDGRGSWSGPRIGNVMLGPQHTPKVIREVLIVTAVAFLVQALFGLMAPGGPGQLPAIVEYGGLRPSWVVRGAIWMPLTSLLLHGDLGHLFGNMFFLWMFGSPVAEMLGRRHFLLLYVGGGLLGGLLVTAASALLLFFPMATGWVSWDVPTIGASGAVFSVVAVYCFSWPKKTINLLFVPLVFEARWLLALEFLTEFGWATGSVNHASHLAGALIGWLYVRWLRGKPAPGSSPPPPRRPRLRVVRGGDDPVYH